jgi:hypothetical protein
MSLASQIAAGFTRVGQEVKLKAPLDSPAFTTGASITGNLTVSGNVTAATPTSGTHLATKNYVDTHGGGGTTKYAVTDVTGTGQSVQLATSSGTLTTATWTAATADATMLAPTDMSTGDTLKVFIQASGAARVITPSGFIASSDFSTAARTIASGKTAIFTLACVSSGVMVAGYLVQA